MSDMDKKYYVYIHIRNDNGEVFYVGKGHGVRYKVKTSRNKWWKHISQKYGFTPIILQDAMSEDDAFLLESWFIAKFRNEGVELCNLTDGGEGASGLVVGTSTRINRRNINGGKTVYCSNGMEFYSQHEATRWLKKTGYPDAQPIHISRCVNGKINSAYGYAWSYDETPVAPEYTGYIAGGKSRRKKVKCLESGCVYESIADARDYLVSIGWVKASGANIISSCIGKYDKAYGFRWRYA